MKAITKKWIDHAVYDLKTAEVMLKGRRYLYVAFMCQQAIEKLIKGIIEERKGITPPYSHRLSALVKVADIQVDGKTSDFMDLLTRYYINARYPEQKQKLSRALNRNVTSGLFRRTKELFQCLKKELET